MVYNFQKLILKTFLKISHDSMELFPFFTEVFSHMTPDKIIIKEFDGKTNWKLGWLQIFKIFIEISIQLVILHTIFKA